MVNDTVAAQRRERGERQRATSGRWEQQITDTPNGTLTPEPDIRAMTPEQEDQREAAEVLSRS